MTKVVIGIQVKSGTKNSPGRGLSLEEEKTMAQDVVASAGSAAGYVNRTKTNPAISSLVSLLIPKDDPIKGLMTDEIILEGSEKDVFSRYYEAMQKFNADYIVRITGDCPEIPPNMISKEIFCSMSKESFDYISNTIEGLRTYPDGYDCEIMSKKIMEHLKQNISTDYDKEHVTSFLIKNMPSWAKIGTLMNHTDESEEKKSIDYREEYKAYRKRRKSLREKFNLAKERNIHVFRF